MRLFALLFFCVAASQELNEFREVYTWTTFDLNWGNQTPSGRPVDVVFSDLRVWRDRLYVTLPRLVEGVPVTLASMPAQSTETSPALDPFPSWEMQTLGNCSALQFVRTIEIDLSGKMWVPDSGGINPLTGDPTDFCPRKLLIIDVESREIERTIHFQEGLLGANSLFAYIVVDDNDIAYISDCNIEDPGIVVVRASDGAAWKVRDPSMRTDGDTLEIGGRPVLLQDNVFALTLSPRPRDGSPRRLYYSPLPSNELFSVPVDALQTPGTSLSGLVQSHGRMLSPVQAAVADWHGYTYQGLQLMDAVALWDPQLPLSDAQLLVQDHQRLVWMSALTIDADRNLWVVSNNMQNYFVGAVNPNTTNYRVIRAYVDTMSYLYNDDSLIPQRVRPVGSEDRNCRCIFPDGPK